MTKRSGISPKIRPDWSDLSSTLCLVIGGSEKTLYGFTTTSRTRVKHGSWNWRLNKEE